MFLHSSIIYGPVRSRRLGLSLGINLLPVKRKQCNFECVYCECGWKQTGAAGVFPQVDEFQKALTESAEKLSVQGVLPDHFTFSGNGEPTLHPDLETIMDITVRLRNRYFPDTKIAVLSNAATLNHSGVRSSLKKADRRIFKLDAGSEAAFHFINQPEKGITLDGITDSIKKTGLDFTVQTLFLRGRYSDGFIDNTTEEELTLWLNRLQDIRPVEVMIYSLDRRPAADGLNPVSFEELKVIKDKVIHSGLRANAY